MQISLNVLFLIFAVGMAIWMKKDSGFKMREFLLSGLFFMLALSTNWGSQGQSMFKDLLGNILQSVSNFISQIS